MSIDAFRDEVSEEVSAILSPKFDVEVIETNFVPKPDDPRITFPNTDYEKQSCKLIETCVLYIDIRKSTELNLSHRQATVAKLYSAFGRSMTRAAKYYGGHVRGIVGDRVMVVFDKIDCFEHAVNTSVLMNSVAKYVLDKKFDKNEINCGIGIDYGKMLVTKVGIVRRGEESSNYKGLVWLGRPANVASKLTDLANKPEQTKWEECVHVGRYYPNIGEWSWGNESYANFVGDLENIPLSNRLQHKDGYFRSHFKTGRNVLEAARTPPILMTKEVFAGFKKACPDDNIIQKNWIQKKSLRTAEYGGEVYGGDVTFTAFKS